MPKPKKLILQNYQSPGDMVMLTAAVRDLHLAYPFQFITDVNTSAGAIWENNPFITKLKWHKQKRKGKTHIIPDEGGAKAIECHYPLVLRSNRPYHFIHGFAQDLEKTLGVRIPLTKFCGDIHLSEEEKSWISQVEGDEIGYKGDFWVIVAGGKQDFTTKWWDPSRYQKVVDYFRGRIRFVQVGQKEHWHPRLNNVIDLVGKADLRQFIRLIYHSVGVLCPVTLAMHLAAAVEVKPGRPRNRACVVIAGGREPSHWEAYPHHQYIHRNGTLSCCDDGGCWASRCQKIGDGDKKDEENLCVRPIMVGQDLLIPECMEMISVMDVIRAIELYYLHDRRIKYGY